MGCSTTTRCFLVNVWVSPPHRLRVTCCASSLQHVTAVHTMHLTQLAQPVRPHRLYCGQEAGTHPHQPACGHAG